MKDARTSLLWAAREVLSRDAIDAVGRVLRPEALATATRELDNSPISRPTAYRVLGTRNETVIDFAHFLTVPAKQLADERLEEARKDVAPEDSRREPTYDALRNYFCKMLRENLEMQFSAEGMPAGWILQGVAITSSPLWKGQKPSSELQSVGREILSARASLYDHAAEGWASLLRQAMAAYTRRPRTGFTIELIIKLMHAMFDGCVQRLLVDSSLNDPSLSDVDRQTLFDANLDMMANAMFEMTWAYTQSGALEDPRRPTDKASTAFDAIVAEAARLYSTEVDSDAWSKCSKDDLVRPSAAAHEANRSTSVAEIWFPEPGDLVDSVMRRLVAPPDREFGISPGSAHPTLLIEAVLGRLSRAVDSHPRAILGAQRSSPSRPTENCSLLDELHQAITEALRSPNLDCANPFETAKSLVELSLLGSRGWSGVRAVLNVLGLEDQAQSVVSRLDVDQREVLVAIQRLTDKATSNISGLAGSSADESVPKVRWSPRQTGIIDDAGETPSERRFSAEPTQETVSKAMPVLIREGLVRPPEDDSSLAVTTELGEAVSKFLRGASGE